MSREDHAVIPPHLVIRLEEQAQKVLDTIRYSSRFERGPDIVVQSLFMTLIRVGARKDLNVHQALQDRLAVAWQQYKESEADG